VAKRNLTTETMVQLSEAWLDPKRARTSLSSLPVVSALLPKIEEAHGELLARQPAAPSGAVVARITAIQAKQAALDARHDRKMRGAVKLLDALADLADDPEDAHRYQELSVLLCPEGVKGIIKSYSDESGAAKLLEGRIDDGVKKQLGKIAIPGGKLLDTVNDWIEAAVELGALDDEKNALGKEGARPSDAIDARNKWIRTAAALETALEISGADETAIAKILGPLRDAEARADRRKGTAGRGGEAEGEKALEEKKGPEGG
jgi:hypothetical protein